MDAKLFDIVCTLPLSSDLITLAAHPKEPVFVVGLASGHIQAFRLPDAPSSPSKDSTNEPTNGDATESSKRRSLNEPASVKFSDKITNTPQKRHDKDGEPRRSSLLRTSDSPTPPNGYGMIETQWKTRRHKGSCRALAFSADGKTLFSAGTDGIIKAADSATGRVVGKALIPGKSAKAHTKSHPSQLLVLNPQSLVLGDDEGGVHEYELGQVSLKENVSMNGVNGDSSAKETRLTPKKSQPKKTHFPHRTENDPTASESITSLTALPPSGASTSGVSKSWVSTAGSTLAVCDIHRGVIKCSIEQGAAGEPWELLSSVCLSGRKSEENALSFNGTSQGAKKRKSKETSDDQITILVGDSSGGCGFWRKGQWEDRSDYRRLKRQVVIEGVPLEDYGVESLAVAPLTEKEDEPLIVAGLATGTMNFLRPGPSRRDMESSVTHVHDERGLDSCSALAFDVEGRMISGGGSMVRVWHREPQENAFAGLKFSEDEDGNGLVDSMEEDEPGDIVSDDEGSISDLSPKRQRKDSSSDSDKNDGPEDSNESSDTEERRKKRRKKGKKVGKKANGSVKNDGRGDHGIMKFSGLD